MRIHILGVCGTFMGGLAVLARQLGHIVTGSDAQIYPPMSTQLEQQGVVCLNGYDPAHLDPPPDQVIIGNALSRGNPAVEYVLRRKLPYDSGPQWLFENVLSKHWVMAVAGTHGKTTTTAMLAWILERAGLNPGFLIGGAPLNFGVSARLTDSPFFVIEADEYDTAFFDKRSKFIHYRPHTLILNNLEYDHADIFPDMAAIEQQFHHLVRTTPDNGLIICQAKQAALERVLKKGCWTEIEYFGAADSTWRSNPLSDDFSRFEVIRQGEKKAALEWSLLGLHNQSNALAAIAAAHHAGASVEQACQALHEFKNVKRRLEVYGTRANVTIYDDFAHHPTAIEASLQALRAKVGQQRILALVDIRSNTMKLGVHKEILAPALAQADIALIHEPPALPWRLASDGRKIKVFEQTGAIIDWLLEHVQSGDHVLVMSNGGFENIHERLLSELSRLESAPLAC